MSGKLSRRYQVIRQDENSSLDYHKYNISFTHSQSKETNKKQLKKLAPICTSRTFSLRKNESKQIERAFTRTFVHSFQQARSQSIQSPAKYLQFCQQKKQSIDEERFYVTRYGFPRRKKKTGDQQLLKLLLKFRDSITFSLKYRQQLQKIQGPLFDQNAQTHQKIIPKLKCRTRFNWYKGQQYCRRVEQFSSDRHPVINDFESEYLH